MNLVGIGVADIRKEPKFESERDSQLIFGEKVKVISEAGEYSKVLCPDGLEGYIKSRLVKNGEERRYKLISFFDAGEVKMPFGSYVSENDVLNYKIPEKKLVEIGDTNYSVVELSYKFLGVPYLWGGTSDFGFDCSGFVQRLYRFIGKELPRNADWQRDFTTKVESFKDALPGDLIFFRGHVALYLGNGHIIHANGHSASVSIDNLFIESNYKEKLMSIFEKIGRVEKSL